MADNLNDPQQAALFREIDEDLRNDQLKNFWQKYRFILIGICIALVLGTAFYEGFKYYRNQNRMADSASFNEASLLAAEGNFDPAIVSLETIIARDKTDYAELASLKKVTILEQSDKKDEALSLLYSLKGDSSLSRPIRDIATIALAERLLDKDDVNFAELQDMLAPLTAKDSAWTASALELSALAYLRDGKPAQALEQLELVYGNTQLAPAARDRARSLISVIKKGAYK